MKGYIYDPNVNLGDSNLVAPSQKAVKTYVDSKATQVKQESSIPASGKLLPNVFYNLGTLEGSDVKFSLDDTIPGIRCEYTFAFCTGNTVPGITWPTGIIWEDDYKPQPSISSNKYYEISVLNGYGFVKDISLS